MKAAMGSSIRQAKQAIRINETRSDDMRNAMTILYLVCLIMFLFLTDATAQGSESGNLNHTLNNQVAEDTLQTTVLKKKDKKSPSMALCYAILPGVIIRGAGHYYAGSRKTAIGLFIITAVSLYATKDTGIGVGPLIFLITWAYDIIAAPLLCIDYNNYMENSVSLQHYSKREAVSGHQIGLRLSYNF